MILNKDDKQTVTVRREKKSREKAMKEACTSSRSWGQDIWNLVSIAKTVKQQLVYTIRLHYIVSSEIKINNHQNVSGAGFEPALTAGI